LEINDTDMEPERKETPPQYTQLKAILCTTSTKQLHNAYYKKLLPTYYLCTSGKFIILPNRIESKKSIR